MAHFLEFQVEFLIILSFFLEVSNEIGKFATHGLRQVLAVIDFVENFDLEAAELGVVLYVSNIATHDLGFRVLCCIQVQPHDFRDDEFVLLGSLDFLPLS